MGLAWQQGPLGGKAVGQFLTPEPLPARLLFAEPLRRRMRVQLGGPGGREGGAEKHWIADSEDVVLLHEPGRYPVAYFPLSDVVDGALTVETRTTRHKDLGATKWFSVQDTPHAAWQFTDLPAHAAILRDRVAFAWRAMDAFYEEDERIVGHAADMYHRVDIRKTSRHLVVRDGDRVIADTHNPLALYESGFAPRWYVPREDIDLAALTPVDGETFCPYKGLASYYDIGSRRRAAWGYPEAWPEVAAVSGWISFEPDVVDVWLDDRKLALEPGQGVAPHGIDRGLDPEELSVKGN
jgi:uncharacterized protein (DUF427 family)